jgi:AraC-like DNA-binding protein
MAEPTRPPPITPAILDRQTPGFGPLRFSLRDVAEHERNDLYRDFFGRSVMRYEVEPSPSIPLDIDATVQILPGLLMATGTMHGSQNRRTRRTLADGLDDFAMAVNLGGRYVVRQGKDEIVLDHGEATMLSLGQPCEFIHSPPGGFLGMRFPRSQIMTRVARADELCMRAIGAGTEALRLLTNYIGIAQQRHTIADPDLRRAFVDHVYDLIAVAVGAQRDAAEEAQERGLRAARLHAIKQDIAGNLARPGLSVAVLADRHGCTPRSVQRLFEAAGTTFTDYVLEHRLMQAHRILSDPHHDGSKICAIAFNCGFGDVSYFNRMFRRRFGAAPSDIRARARDLPRDC